MPKQTFPLLAILLFFCLPILNMNVHAQDLTRHQFRSVHMGTEFRIVLYAPDDFLAGVAADSAFARIEELNGILSDYIEESELNRLSRSSGNGQPVQVSEPLFHFLLRSHEISRITGGAFDITIGPFVRLWRELNRNPRPELPGRDEIRSLGERVGYRFVKIDVEKRAIELTRTGMQLDPGAIGKGYAADEALKVLNHFGIYSAFIDAGGDITLGNPPPGRKYWDVAVPLHGENDTTSWLKLKLANRAVATSGDMFRFVEIDGQQYSHIIDPATGLGVTGQTQATVIASTGTDADAYASALNVMPPDRGIALVNRLEAIEAFIERNGQEGVRRWESAGFERYVKEW